MYARPLALEDMHPKLDEANRQKKESNVQMCENRRKTETTEYGTKSRTADIYKSVVYFRSAQAEWERG